jgi:hypothetical protein
MQAYCFIVCDENQLTMVREDKLVEVDFVDLAFNMSLPQDN